MHFFLMFPFSFFLFHTQLFSYQTPQSEPGQILPSPENFGEIPTKFHQHLASKWQNSIKKCWNLKNSLFIFEKSLTIFDWNFEVWAVQKYANLVDRVKSFPTSIYLQKSASIQPRTSLSKFEVIYSLLFIRLLSETASGGAYPRPSVPMPCTHSSEGPVCVKNMK